MIWMILTCYKTAADSNLSLGVGYSTGDDVDALLFNIRLDTK